MTSCDDCGHEERLHQGVGFERRPCWARRPLCSCNEYVPSPSTPGRDLVAVILSLAVLVLTWGWFLTWGWM